MPKAKPAAVGLYADTKVYRSGCTMYRILSSGECLFESSSEATRDYLLKRMQEREAEKGAELGELVLDN